MAEQKEKAEGTWDGRQIRFTRNFRGHRFTDAEVASLLAGEEVEVHDLKSPRTGNTYSVKGKLTDQVFKRDDGSEFPFVGFEQTGFVSAPGVPKSWCQHVFTEDEREALERGEKIFVEGFVSSKGNSFDCTVSYGAEKPGDDKKIIPHFGEK